MGQVIASHTYLSVMTQHSINQRHRSNCGKDGRGISVSLQKTNKEKNFGVTTHINNENRVVIMLYEYLPSWKRPLHPGFRLI